MLELRTQSTRRTILALAATAPALGFSLSASALPARSSASASWDRAFAAWRCADELNATTPASDQNWDALGDEENRLWRALMVMPSPNAAALLWKIEYLWGSTTLDHEYCDSWTSDIVQHVVRDAWRLLSGETGEASHA